MTKDSPSKRPRRSKGEGAITELRDGRFRGAIWLPDPAGNMRRKFVRGRSRAEVSRKFVELREQAKAGFPDGTTTGAYLAKWTLGDGRVGIRAATHREYVRHVERYWTPLIGSVELTRLTPQHVSRAMADLEGRGLSKTTVRSARVTLRRALRDAQTAGLVNRNVAALARPPAVERPEMRALTKDEVARLVTATTDDPFGPLFALAVGSGLRLGEIVALSWDDVDMEDRKLTVRRTLARAYGGGYDFAEPKTKRSRRTVMLPALAVDALRRQKARQAGMRLAAGSAWQDRRNLVFTDAVGRPVVPDHVSKAFRSAADRLGLPVRFHDLRHTSATLMLAAGVPLKVVSETLGHASIVVTADVYAHVTPDLKREAADAMDRALGGA
jgi:integrase